MSVYGTQMYWELSSVEQNVWHPRLSPAVCLSGIAQVWEIIFKHAFKQPHPLPCVSYLRSPSGCNKVKTRVNSDC